MKDGSMFGNLKKKALNKDWYNNDENLVVTYQTEKMIYTYKVFATYETSKQTNYLQRTFASDQEYVNYLNTLKSRSVKDFGHTMKNTDKIMTFSTCATNSNNRVVIHAVLIDTATAV